MKVRFQRLATLEYSITNKGVKDLTSPRYRREIFFNLKL
jgi:hypothetical protein